MKVRDVIKLIEDDGWEIVSQRGSHRQYRHPSKTGTVTIAGHPGDEVKPGTLARIMQQADIRRTP